jgi:integrase
MDGRPRRRPNGERGAVHTYQPCWSEKDPKTGVKRLVRGKSWCWRFRFRGQRYGECGDKRTGLPFAKRGDALKAGEARKAEVVAGYVEDPHRTTFAKLAATITALASVKSARTQACAAGVVARLGTYFRADESAMDIGRVRLLGYKPFREAAPYHSQASTIKLDLKWLRRAMIAAHQDGLLLRVPPFPQISAPPRAETFRQDEFDRLLAALPEWWRRFFLIADEMGWRESELRSRTWPDVDWDNGFVLLDAAHSKTGKARTFPISKWLAERLRDQRAWVRQIEDRLGIIVPFVFCQPDGKPLGRPKDAWKRACAKAGFGKLDGRRGPWSGAKVAHDVRRTTMRRWDRLMLPLGGRMAAAGHDSQATHEGYLGGDPETLAAMAERLDEDRRRREGEPAKVAAFKKAAE